ncbi:hypothetical protein F8M41_012934 [Gigaspora margarita]|uniref:Uncharacterized protein n=1 Tax=Gigaspora margarita TaxID=4874 RepID=A0A8H3X0G0_GIGMA|nr:hypothetical protein F8M41_012934 [Gigaspora margarita]
MAGNFVVRENIMFEEIEVDKGEGVLKRNKNERTILEENEVIVLEDSKKENEKILEILTISAPNEAHIVYERAKVYISQFTIPDQR